MAQAEAPVQPLPPWMATTWLQIGPSSSTFVTLQFPQTYSGPSLPGLTWPWVYQPTDALAGTPVSIVGGPAGLTTVGGTFATSEAPSLTASASTLSSPPLPTARPSMDATTSELSTLPPTSATSSPSLASSASSTPSLTSSTFSSSPSSMSSTIQTSNTPVPSIPAQSVDPASSDLSPGAIVGLVLGVLALLLLMLFLLALCQRRKRARDSQANFTMLEPETRYAGDEIARTASRTRYTDKTSQVPIVPGPARGSSPRRYMSDRFSPRALSARDVGEGNPLMSYADEEERNEDEEARTVGPPIMLQSASSGESVRHCPSNNSLSTTHNTDSTRTRASLISQFPMHDRKSSNHSSRGGHDQGGAGGGSGAAGPSGSRPSETKEGHHSGSGKSGSDGAMFSSPPPRPPSRTRTVPGQGPPANIGLGRPPGSPKGPRGPRLASLPERPTNIPYTRATVNRNLSNRSSRSLMGAPAWMKGFTWLSPFFDTSAQDAATPMRQENAGNDDLERGGEVRLSEDRLLPTAAPVMREVPHYRRVTTTAAAYDVQDLRDLAQRRTAERSEDVEICSNGEDSASDGEGSSFLESSRLQQSPPTTISGEQGSSSRWSRATLGQPLQRISAISSLSLSDIPSLAESMTSSAKVQGKARRSRSASRSTSSHKVSHDSLSRVASRATLASHGHHSHSSRSRSGSGSEGGQGGSKASSRRNNNSSGGSNASSGHGSHRSTKSGRTALGRVMEDGEAVPPLPPKVSAYD